MQLITTKVNNNHIEAKITHEEYLIRPVQTLYRWKVARILISIVIVKFLLKILNLIQQEMEEVFRIQVNVTLHKIPEEKMNFLCIEKLANVKL